MELCVLHKHALLIQHVLCQMGFSWEGRKQREPGARIRPFLNTECRGFGMGRAKTRLRKAYVAASWFVVDQNIDQGRAKA
jgi:hypothetical protein